MMVWRIGLLSILIVQITPVAADPLIQNVDAVITSTPANIISSHPVRVAEEWHSPSTLSSDFPHISSEDCSHYGADYGYAECSGHKKRRTEEQAILSPEPWRVNTNPDIQTRRKINRTVDDAAQKRSRHMGKQTEPKVEKKDFEPAKTPALRTVSNEQKLRQIIGQLLIVGFDGKQASDTGVSTTLQKLQAGKISGVVFTDRNIENFTQLQTLVSLFGKENKEAVSLLAIDQPGGPKATLSEDKGFNFYSSANLIGLDNKPYDAQLLYADMGKELATIGFNMNIGPSTDICPKDTTPLSATCFGENTKHVAAFVTAFNYGQHDEGILTVLHHTPFQSGWETAIIEDKPSSAILKELTKHQNSDAIVVEGLASPHSASYTLASFSANKSSSSHEKAIIANFSGIIIADLDQAATGPTRFDEALVQSFENGANMILLRNAPQLSTPLDDIAYTALSTAIQKGRLSLAQLENSNKRVKELKARSRQYQNSIRSADTSTQRVKSVSSN